MNEKTSSLSRKRHIGNAVTYAILIIMSIVWLLPFVGLILQSFRSYVTEFGGMVDYVVPKEFSLDNYIYLLKPENKFTLWFKNTFIIAFFTSTLSTMIVLGVSYALSRMRFAGRQAIMKVWLILGMFPGFLTMICLYFLLKNFGLTQEGAIPGLIIISVMNAAMKYYVCKGYFDTVPIALDEAARIDGSGEFRTFNQIVLPIMKPAIAVQAIFTFVGSWNNYFVPALVLHTDKKKTLPILIAQLRSADFLKFDMGQVYVMIAFSIFPVIIVYILLSKFIVEGVSAGAVKG